MAFSRNAFQRSAFQQRKIVEADSGGFSLPAFKKTSPAPSIAEIAEKERTQSAKFQAVINRALHPAENSTPEIPVESAPAAVKSRAYPHTLRLLLLCN